MPDTPTFSSAAVTAPHHLAAQAGRDVLAAGGNAIEAMIAMAAVIAVVYPHMNSIGGDCFFILREPGGRVRAIETRRWVLRAGNDGVTAAIAPSGRVTARLPRRVAGALPVSFAPSTTLTPYVRWGEWVTALSVLALLGLWLGKRRSKAKRQVERRLLTG